MLQKIINSTLFKLIFAVLIGLLLGQYSTEGIMKIIVIAKHLLSQFILFFIPLIIISFISSSIVKMGGMASRLVAISLIIAYLSSIGAAFWAMGLGYAIIPKLSINSVIEPIATAPPLIFELNITPIMGVMSALILALMLGISSIWSKSAIVANLLNDFQKMILSLITRVLIPILPIFIASNFAILSYEGAIINQLPIFINVIFIVLMAQLLWICILYTLAMLVTHQNPWEVIKYYAPPYFTAIGTMSSAATLPISLEAARKSSILRDKSVNFAIPLFSSIHLCGSILTEVFIIMVVSKIIYGTLPDPSTMIIFIMLLGLFAIGAPGVPGGTVIASLGIVVSIIGFNPSATTLLLTIFAIQDSFGTACNIVGDGALTMIIDKFDDLSS